MKAATSSSAKKSMNNLAWSGKPHLINTDQLTKDEVIYLLERAKYFKQQIFGQSSKLDSPKNPLATALAGQVAATMFYENSTRTRLSFTLASKHLGMHVLDLDVDRSSVQKGESLEDTARTLAAMGVNLIVQRHSTPGSAACIAAATNNKVHVINAGEGTTEHPTQGLLDLFTLLEVLDGQTELTNRKIVIVGDVLHSRVAKSNLYLLSLFGAEVHLVAPAQWLPQELAAKGAVLHYTLDEALVNADFVLPLRTQFERQENGIFGSTDNIPAYQVNHQRLKLAKPSVKVYAPGPINRDIEITGEVADDPTISLIERQVQNGVIMRMAIIEALCKAD